MSEQVTVSVPFGAEDNRRDISVSVVAPGLCVFEVPADEFGQGRLKILPWRVTHVDSGRLIAALPAEALALQFAEAIAGCVDWTLSKFDLGNLFRTEPIAAGRSSGGFLRGAFPIPERCQSVTGWRCTDDSFLSYPLDSLIQRSGRGESW